MVLSLRAGVGAMLSLFWTLRLDQAVSHRHGFQAGLRPIVRF